jgi:hypothetical protein
VKARKSLRTLASSWRNENSDFAARSVATLVDIDFRGAYDGLKVSIDDEVSSEKKFNFLLSSRKIRHHRSSRFNTKQQTKIKKVELSATQ